MKPTKRKAGAEGQPAFQNSSNDSNNNNPDRPTAQVIPLRRWLLITPRGTVLGRYATERAAYDAHIAAELRR
jgi:hypothetical protein